MKTRTFSDRGVSPDDVDTSITFFYPFVTAGGEYRAYKIEFTLKEEELNIYQVRQLIESLEFPGKSPFKQ